MSDYCLNNEEKKRLFLEAQEKLKEKTPKYSDTHFSSLKEALKSISEEDKNIFLLKMFYEYYVFDKNIVGTNDNHTDSISVLIPCYKQYQYIQEAIDSVLAETMLPKEIIVFLMDEESYKLKEKLESLSPLVKCYIKEIMNVSKARNELVKVCNCDWLIFLDADDTIENNFIETMYNSEGDVVCCCHDEFSSIYYGYISAFEKLSIPWRLTENPTALFNKKIFKEFKFDEKILFYEDSSFLIEVNDSKKYSFTWTEKTIWHHRVYGNYSLSSFNRNKKNISKSKEVENYICKKHNLENRLNKILPKDVKEDIKNKYSNFIKDCIFIKRDIEERETFSFIFNKKCNKHCEYCFEQNSKESKNDEELFYNFDYMLTKIEQKYKSIDIKILGGEPTMFSERLSKKIIDRTKQYNNIEMFTNGYNKNHILFKYPTIYKNIHIADWKQGFNETELFYDRCFNIVFEHGDEEYLRQFVKNKKNFYIINPCIGYSKECVKEDIIKIIEIIKPYSNFKFYGNFNLNKDDLLSRIYCKKERKHYIEIDCNRMELALCCEMHNNKISFKDFINDNYDKEKILSCNNCYYY